MNNFFIDKNKNPYIAAINKIKKLKIEKKEDIFPEEVFEPLDVVVKEVVNGTDVFEILHVSKNIFENYSFLKKKHLITKDFINALLKSKYKVKVLDKMSNLMLKNFF